MNTVRLRRSVSTLGFLVVFGSAGCSSQAAPAPAGTGADGDTDPPHATTSSGESEGEVTSSNADCGTEPPQVLGSINTSVASLQPADVAAEVHHKRDVDVEEDGCINTVTLAFTAGGGCRLAVTAAGRFVEGDQLEVTSVELHADSQCQGFLDEQEGDYAGTTATLADSWIQLSPTRVPGNNVSSTCFPAQLLVQVRGTLATENGLTLELMSGQLTVFGDIQSSDLDAACPRPAEPPVGETTNADDTSTTGSTSAETSAGDTSTTTSTSTSTTGEDVPEVCEPQPGEGVCATCIREECCDELVDCLADPSCACVEQCLEDNDLDFDLLLSCGVTCGLVATPPEGSALIGCHAAQCDGCTP